MTDKVLEHPDYGALKEFLASTNQESCGFMREMAKMERLQGSLDDIVEKSVGAPDEESFEDAVREFDAVYKELVEVKMKLYNMIHDVAEADDALVN